MLKLTETLYVDLESVVKIQYFKKGAQWPSPPIPGLGPTPGAGQTFAEPALQIRFKRGSPMWLAGSEAEEAWRNWIADRERKS
jgi:hypothetical protein